MKEIHNQDLIQDFMSKSGFPENFSMNVLKDTKLFHFSPRDSIVEEGRAPDFLYFLVRGKAKLYLTHPNGRVSLIDFFHATCFIGEIELINKHHQTLTVQAIENCWCLALPMSKYRPLLMRDVRFLHSLCVILCDKNQRNIATASKNQSFPLENRLASFILLTQHANLYAEKHTLVADYLGVSYRHLLHVFANLCKAAVLKRSEFGYQVLNRKALMKLANQIEADE